MSHYTADSAILYAPLGYPRVCKVMSTTSPIASIANYPLNEKCICVGLRNGSHILADLRCKSSHNMKLQDTTIVKSQVSIDHLHCLSNGCSLLSQNIIGQITEYDLRRFGNVFQNIITEKYDSINTHRFWVSADEKMLACSLFNGSGIGIWNIQKRDALLCSVLEIHDELPIRRWARMSVNSISCFSSLNRHYDLWFGCQYMSCSLNDDTSQYFYQQRHVL